MWVQGDTLVTSALNRTRVRPVSETTWSGTTQIFLFKYCSTAISLRNHNISSHKNKLLSEILYHNPVLYSPFCQFLPLYNNKHRISKVPRTFMTEWEKLRKLWANPDKVQQSQTLLNPVGELSQDLPNGRQEANIAKLSPSPGSIELGWNSHNSTFYTTYESETLYMSLIYPN